MHDNERQRDLVVPVFLWNGAPLHRASCSCLSLEYNLFVTGTEDGCIYLWTVYSEDLGGVVFDPRVVILTRENAPIRAFELIPYNARDCLMGISSRGSVFVVSIEDGSFLRAGDSLFSCNPTRAVLLPDRRHVAVSGDSFFIEILDLDTFSVTNSVCHENWVNDLGWMRVEGVLSLVGLSVNGVVCSWQLEVESYFRRSRHLPMPEFASVRLLSISPSGVACLFVTLDSVIVLNLANFRRLGVFRQKGLYGATWCDDLTVLIWNSSGVGLVYRISSELFPDRVAVTNAIKSSTLLAKALNLPLSDHCEGLIKDLREANDIFSYHSLTLRNVRSLKSNKRCALNRSNFKYHSDGILDLFKFESNCPFDEPFIELQLPPISHDHDLPFLDVGACDNLVYVVLGGGNVVVWALPFFFSKEQIGTRLQPLGTSTISRGWDSDLGSIGPRSSLITCGAVSNSKMQIFYGISDGSIVRKNLPIDPHPLAWVAHNSSVASLLFFSISNVEYLVTGGRDYYIKFWDIRRNPPELTHSIMEQNGPIVSLFRPNELDIKANYKWIHRFLSLTENGSICLYEVVKNPLLLYVFSGYFPVKEIRWRPNEDMLLVSFVNGEVFAWDTLSNSYENVLNARDVLAHSRPLSHVDFGALSDTSSKQSLTAVQISTDEFRPVQVLFFNVNHLVSDIAAIGRLFREKYGKSGIFSLPFENYFYRRLCQICSQKDGSVDHSRFLYHLLSHDNSVCDLSSTLARYIEDIPESTFMELKLDLRSSSAYRSISYLMPWNLNDDWDRFLSKLFFLDKIDSNVSYGLFDGNWGISMLVPKHPGSRLWTTSKKISTIHCLVHSVAMNVLFSLYDDTLPPDTFEHSLSGSFAQYSKSIFSRLKSIPEFLNPDLCIIYEYFNGFEGNSRSASYFTFFNTIMNTPDQELYELVKNLRSDLSHLQKGQFTHSNIIFILATMALFRLDIFGSQFLNHLGLMLIDIILEGESLARLVAAELLFGNFGIWSPYLQKNIEKITSKLLKLITTDTEFAFIRNGATSSLLYIGIKNPLKFFSTLCKFFDHLIEKINGIAFIFFNYKKIIINEQILSAFAELLLGTIISGCGIYGHRQNLNMIVACLAKLSYLYVSIGEGANGVLGNLIETVRQYYPMVSYDEKANVIAVGTTRGNLAAYNMLTSERLYEVHLYETPVDAVAVLENLLATFSKEQNSLKIWKVDLSLIGALTKKIKLIKTIEIPRLRDLEGANKKNFSEDSPIDHRDLSKCGEPFLALNKLDSKVVVLKILLKNGENLDISFSLQ